MKLYVVHMYRWGNEDDHSYIEGVYSTRAAAKRHGKAESTSRAGKYEFKIWVHELDMPRQLKYMSDRENQRAFKNNKRTAKLIKEFHNE